MIWPSLFAAAYCGDAPVVKNGRQSGIVSSAELIEEQYFL